MQPGGGSFSQAECAAPSFRKYSSRLWGIDGDWRTACEHTPAWINTVYYDHPWNCVDWGIGGMWVDGKCLIARATRTGAPSRTTGVRTTGAASSPAFSGTFLIASPGKTGAVRPLPTYVSCFEAKFCTAQMYLFKACKPVKLWNAVIDQLVSVSSSDDVQQV